jgi:Transglycosylase SLT domain
MKLTGLMKILLGACIIVAIAVAYPASQREAALIWDKTVAIYGAERQIAKAEPGYFSRADYESSTMPAPDLTYLADYAYSEVPPDERPADTVLKWLSATPVGTPIEEIIRASEAFGLDESFMIAVARIESGFDPKEVTGSYIGLFQLSHYEFDKYGSGDIIDARDNAIAAAYKFTTAAIMFELVTHKKPTLSDLYLIHQQGTQGAAEHVSHPDRIAWESMCATDEGREKGEKWCKRAIWANTLPDIKKIAKSVDKLTSGDFVQMWRSRVAEFYSYYTAAMAAK